LLSAQVFGKTKIYLTAFASARRILTKSMAVQEPVSMGKQQGVVPGVMPKQGKN
jgi:hypothetical protein